MGSYATTTAIETLLVGSNVNTATRSMISLCIDWAENEVNKKLANRYDVSAFATSVPPMVKTLSEQIAVAYFHYHNSRGSKESIGRYKELIKMPMDNLADLACGKAGLVDSSGDQISVRSGRLALSSTLDYTPTFAEDKPTSWKVDTDKLDAIRNDRD